MMTVAKDSHPSKQSKAASPLVLSTVEPPTRRQLSHLPALFPKRPNPDANSAAAKNKRRDIISGLLLEPFLDSVDEFILLPGRAESFCLEPCFENGDVELFVSSGRARKRVRPDGLASVEEMGDGRLRESPRVAKGVLPC